MRDRLNSMPYRHPIADHAQTPSSSRQAFAFLLQLVPVPLHMRHGSRRTSAPTTSPRETEVERIGGEFE